MLLQFSNYFKLRGSRGMPILLILLLSLSIAAGGSITSSQKSTSTQQQQMVAQQQKQQPNLQQHQSQQAHLQQQQHAHLEQQQQQVPSLHQRMQQQNGNSQMQQDENEPQLLTSQNLPSDISNADYIVKDVDIDEEINDPYQYLSDLKMEPRLTTGNSLPWNPYNAGTSHQAPAHMPVMFNHFPFTSNPYGAFGHSSISPMVTPRFIPFFSYPQPVYMPLPMYLAAAASSDLFYPDFIGSGNELDDSMPRAIGDHRRVQSSQFGPAHTTSGIGSRPPPPPPSARNSQIYFMRLAPMPYGMFMPGGLGFTTMQGSIPDPYNPLASAISPILNIPINFLANGKPTNIYQFGGTPNDFASSIQFNNVNPFGLRPPAAFSPSYSFGGSQRPSSANVGGSFAASQGSYGSTTATQSHSAQQQDSKMTLLKRPFFFNGRPDEIYTLPNNFNAIYSNSGYY